MDAESAPGPAVKPQHGSAPGPVVKPQHGSAPGPVVKPQHESAPGPVVKPQPEPAPESATEPETGAAPGAGGSHQLAPAPSALGDPPKPLHDPDPYSTPPYGEPGPWAPAPPVQHPAAATHAQGMAPPTPAFSAPVSDATASAPAPGGMAPAPVPGATPPASALGGMPTAPDAGGTAPVSGGMTPAPPPGAPAPAGMAPAPPPGAPAPAGMAPAPVPGATSHAPAPGLGGTAFTPAPHPTAPAPGGMAPTSAPGATAPASTSGATTPGAPLPPPPPTPASPSEEAPAAVSAAASASAAEPWQRYDPWSAAPLASTALAAPSASGGALQQTGAAVLTAGQRRGRARKRLVGGALALALVSGVFGGVVGVHLERNGGFDGVKLPQAAAEPTGRAADSVAGIAARALPSVVTLHVSGSEEAGTGTGFVLDSLGHILTNNHVVEPAGSDGDITVVFNGGQTAQAEIVGGDSGYDLAVVKVTGVKGLKPLYLGNSDNVQVGDPVVAIGAPFDLEGTVTSGIISAKERPITAGGESGDGSDVSYVDALQTDAPINPGNSGGPLLDTRGRVIGINSAIRSAADGTGSDSGQAGSIGLGFAIPINQGKRVAEELINTGKATHPVIGITLDMDYAGDGARVGTEGGDGGSPVTPGGPGDRAGIRAGDVITEVDGQRIHSGEELIVKTRAHRPGDRLELTIERDGKERTLSLVLGSSD
ncbi:trypsin-like peptidase domain-containing protein [Streptomyces sp. NPDC052016]|uniref:trypsin-like peptidase domain-containing protein n=1 Tax=Streptomyces sp. NPDC052016 TaxID=3365680 RepID=UPI0037CEC543